MNIDAGSSGRALNYGSEGPEFKTLGCFLQRIYSSTTLKQVNGAKILFLMQTLVVLLKESGCMWAKRDFVI